jgi:hypothetical protein
VERGVRLSGISIAKHAFQGKRAGRILPASETIKKVKEEEKT